MQLVKLKTKTNHCKMCFKEINDNSFYNIIHKDNLLCESCFSTLKARFIKFKINNIEALSIYEYDETIKKLIYTFKGCYDYELKDMFLNRYKTYLKLKYWGYSLVTIPSSDVDDQKRGFNHVKEMFSLLKMNRLEVLEKCSREKQSSKCSKDRLKIDEILISKNIEQVKNKKILIVDDIYTTGATMFKAIQLIKKGCPKKIKVLVVAKTIELDKRNNKNERS